MEEKKTFNSNKYKQQYNKEHYERFVVNLPKDLYTTLVDKLKELNITKSQFLKKSIEDILKK